MTMRELARAETRMMRGVVFTALSQVGQRAKHENELRKLGFEVDTRDFPKTYNLDAYDVVFICKDHAFDSDKTNAEAAAKKSGKPWFRITKKTSNPTWDAVAAYARKLGLQPRPDVDSHAPTFTGRSFAEALGDHLAKKGDAAEWEDLAKEYEQQALSAKQAVADAEARYTAAEAEIKELRKRLQLSADDGNSTAAQREAYRRDLALAKGEADRLAKEVVALRDSNKAIIADREDAIRARSAMRKDYERAVEQRDQQTSSVRRLQDELKTAREELAELREGGDDSGMAGELQKKLNSANTMLTRARRERDDLADTIKRIQEHLKERDRVIVGLQEEIDRRVRETPVGRSAANPNMAATVEKIWSLVGDGILEADEAMEKIIAKLKGE